MTTPVLLVGQEAADLAARLELSGYVPWVSREVEAATAGDPLDAAPEVVVVSPDQRSAIAALRLRWGPVPVLLGIAADTVDERSRCLSSGADDFWLTSLGPSDLLTRLRLHLGLAERRREPVELLQLADLQVLPASRQVKRGRRPVALTAREYQLLLLLLRHRGEVLSRERILREVWDDQSRAASNVIEVYISYLRQKLEAQGERRLIHTARGRGYCLSDGLPLHEP